MENFDISSGADNVGDKEKKALNLGSYWKVSFASIALLFVSMFIDLSGAQIGNTSVSDVFAKFLQYGIPLSLAAIFFFSAVWARNALSVEIAKNDLTEGEISRIIEKYTGLVDGIGTAMPLIGAAILLYTIGYEFENDETRKLAFSGFAVPFEIKAILILASAKLFESVFDEMALNFQVLCKESNVISPFQTDNWGDSMEKLLDPKNKEAISNLNTLMNTMKEIGITNTLEKMTLMADSLGKPLESMKDNNVKESLNTINELAGFFGSAKSQEKGN